MKSIVQDLIVLIAAILIAIPTILYLESNSNQDKFEKRRNEILELSRTRAEQCDIKFQGYARSSCHYSNIAATIELISQERKSLGL